MLVKWAFVVDMSGRTTELFITNVAPRYTLKLYIGRNRTYILRRGPTWLAPQKLVTAMSREYKPLKDVSW